LGALRRWRGDRTVTLGLVRAPEEAADETSPPADKPDTEASEEE